MPKAKYEGAPDFSGPVPFLFAICVALVLFSCPASALIVYHGKIVPAWPEDSSGTGYGTAGWSGGGSAESAKDAAKSAAGAAGRVAGAAGNAAHFYPHPAGVVWGLTLLVDFSDQAPAFTSAEIDAWLNQKGFNRFGCNGSVHDYYADVSNGKVDFRNEIHGFYRAKKPKSYYEGGDGYTRSEELVAEMMDHFDSTVDFSKFDNDKDGKVEAISIVYAGSGVTWGQGLWPHAGGLNQKRDGVQLTRYMMTDLGTSLSLYVFCHECGHMLFGWPDLYGFGDYCLMGNRPNDLNPVTINDFFRADQGWLDVVDVDRNTNAFYRAAANSATAYRCINPARPQECFFWSNLRNDGRRAALQGRGLLMLHFDKDIGVNAPPNPLCLAVVPADGKHDLDTTMWPAPGSDPQDYFSRSTGASFGPATRPASQWNDGSASGLYLHDIASAADTMGFYVGVGAVGIARGNAHARAGAEAFKSVSLKAGFEADGSAPVYRVEGTRVLPCPGPAAGVTIGLSAPQ